MAGSAASIRKHTSNATSNLPLHTSKQGRAPGTILRNMSGGAWAHNAPRSQHMQSTEMPARHTSFTKIQQWRHTSNHPQRSVKAHSEHRSSRQLSSAERSRQPLPAINSQPKLPRLPKAHETLLRNESDVCKRQITEQASTNAQRAQQSLRTGKRPLNSNTITACQRRHKRKCAGTTRNQTNRHLPMSTTIAQTRP